MLSVSRAYCKTGDRRRGERGWVGDGGNNIATIEYNSVN